LEYTDELILWRAFEAGSLTGALATLVQQRAH
jgi:hypothetical protein